MGLRIAFLGTRGLPATFGGVEHHVESIGWRLVERGHQVTVFSQAAYMGADAPRRYRGIRVVRVPSVRSKHFEAIVHSAISTVRAMGASFDIIHYHAVGPGVMSPLPRFFSRTAVVQTIHGLDAERAKWGGLAKWLLNGATWLSARVPDVTVTVSQALADHYLSRYGRSCVFVPNGVDRRPPRGPGQLGHLGLLGNDYLLFVGRLVPEKNPDLLMRAFRDVETDQRLVLVGGSSYSDDYYKTLHRLAAEDKRVVMPGYIYGEVLEALYSNAIGFVLPSSLEGLPLTLLEAIESGLPVIASDIDPHVEVLEGESAGGRLFPNGDSTALTEAMRELLANVDSARHGASALRNRVLARYDWDKSVDCLEQVYATAMRRSDGP